MYEEVLSPVTGTIVKCEDVDDFVFSTNMLGAGIAILPSLGEVVAPVDGEIIALFPTKHAIGLRTNSGIEILIHIGLDTVNLNGEYFKAHVAQDDQVKKGQLLVEFNIEKIKEQGYNSVIPVIITNTPNYQNITPIEQTKVKQLEPLLNIE